MIDAGARSGFGPRTPVLVIILVAYLMIVMDMSIVITPLPEIRDTLGLTEANLSWVQNAYLLAYGGFLFVGARGRSARPSSNVYRRRRDVYGCITCTRLSNPTVEIVADLGG